MRLNHVVDYGPFQVQTCVKPEGGQYTVVLQVSDCLIETSCSSACSGFVQLHFSFCDLDSTAVELSWVTSLNGQVVWDIN